MRTLIRFALFLCCFAVYTASAQNRTDETVTTTDSTGKQSTVQVTRVGTTEDITPRKDMIVVNPLKFLLFYNVSYYHALSPNLVVGGGFQIPSLSGMSGFGLNAEMRFHPSGKALRGFYVAPNISYNSLSLSDGIGDKITSSPFSVGALLGWQWFPGDDFAIGLGIGVDYYIGSVSSDAETTSLGRYSGTAPALRFDIGYAW